MEDGMILNAINAVSVSQSQLRIPFRKEYFEIMKLFNISARITKRD